MKATIAVKLDLSDERQRHMQGAIERMHSGNAALFRALAMRQDGHVIHEAAELLPRTGKRPRYSLVTWNIAECGVTWKPARSRREAVSALNPASR